MAMCPIALYDRYDVLCEYRWSDWVAFNLVAGGNFYVHIMYVCTMHLTCVYIVVLFVFFEFVFFSVRQTEHNVCSVCGLCYDRVSFIGLHVHFNITERTRKHRRDIYYVGIYLVLCCIWRVQIAMCSSVCSLYVCLAKM